MFLVYHRSRPEIKKKSKKRAGFSLPRAGKTVFGTFVAGLVKSFRVSPPKREGAIG
jgi:hypothetical protein